MQNYSISVILLEFLSKIVATIFSGYIYGYYMYVFMCKYILFVTTCKTSLLQQFYTSVWSVYCNIHTHTYILMHVFIQIYAAVVNKQKLDKFGSKTKT